MQQACRSPLRCVGPAGHGTTAWHDNCTIPIAQWAAVLGAWSSYGTLKMRAPKLTLRAKRIGNTLDTLSDTSAGKVAVFDEPWLPGLGRTSPLSEAEGSHPLPCLVICDCVC